MEQMMERLLAKIDANQEEMKADITNRESIKAGQEQMSAEMKSATETNNEKDEVLQENVWAMLQELDVRMHSLAPPPEWIPTTKK
jgi:hypothetical protein